MSDVIRLPDVRFIENLPTPPDTMPADGELRCRVLLGPVTGDFVWVVNEWLPSESVTQIGEPAVEILPEPLIPDAERERIQQFIDDHGTKIIAEAVEDIVGGAPFVNVDFGEAVPHDFMAVEDAGLFGFNFAGVRTGRGRSDPPNLSNPPRSMPAMHEGREIDASEHVARYEASRPVETPEQLLSRELVLSDEEGQPLTVAIGGDGLCNRDPAVRYMPFREMDHGTALQVVMNLAGWTSADIARILATPESYVESVISGRADFARRELNFLLSAFSDIARSALIKP